MSERYLAINDNNPADPIHEIVGAFPSQQRASKYLVAYVHLGLSFSGHPVDENFNDEEAVDLYFNEVSTGSWMITDNMDYGEPDSWL
jgi:hypothetical protein